MIQLPLATSTDSRKSDDSAPSGPASKNARRSLVASIILGSIIVHAIGLLALGAWKLASLFRPKPEARFEMRQVVKIPPQTPEHKMNVAKHEAMAPKPVFNDKLVSLRPVDFALPEMPQMDLNQMLPLDPSELISDQVAGLAGSAGLGTGLGSGLSGAGGSGSGLSFLGVKTNGQRIVLLFDVSSSVLNKAVAAGIPMNRIKEETLKLIDGLPPTARFSLIQFTQNYKVLSPELLAATPDNKAKGVEWVEKEWVDSGSMSGGRVISNERGVVAVLELAFAMKPEVVFLISDASFQWRAGGGNGNIGYDILDETMKRLHKAAGSDVKVHFLGFQPRQNDVAEWKKILRREKGEFRILEQVEKKTP